MNRISFYGEQRYCSLRNNTNLRVVLLKFKVDITRVFRTSCVPNASKFKIHVMFDDINWSFFML